MASLTVSSGVAWAEAQDLTLDASSSLAVDYADSSSVIDLEGGILTLKGDSALQLSGCGEGDGKTYILFTGISALKDAAGNAINLDSSNNAIANYFDTTLPGSGFWADATLQMTADGTLQLVRYTDITLPTGYGATVTVDDVSDISTYSSSATDVIFRVDSSNLTNHCLTINGRSSALMTSSADSWYFTSTDVNSLSSLTFSNATTLLFHVANEEKLDFAYLKSVTFSGNSSSTYGGAIYVDAVTLSGNGAVTFSGNNVTATGEYSSAYGGAISAEDGTVTLSGNGAVTFSGNNATATGEYSDADGGAIYASGGTVTLSGNGDVTFSGNTASSTDYSAYGGAIRATTVTLSGNGVVTFSGNTASSTGRYAHGGAIYAEDGTVTLSGNGDVTFSGNTASGSYTDGGAICAYGGIVTLSDNGAVTFSGNTADYGGAIYADYNGTVTLSGNGDVTFIGNTASSTDHSANGGAIDAYGGTVTLSDNGAVTFSGNSASSTDYDDACGGAISAEDGTVTLSGNGDVLFEKNTEVEKGIYRLRSIYTMNLNLSASADKKIEFRDSIYASGRVKLNEGGAGNIIFTGATTEADLLSVKGSAGTDSEIANSRLSALGHVELFGGSLMVQHQATLQSKVFMVKQDADATLVLDDGQFDAGVFIFDSGNTLSLKGKNTLSTGYGKIDGTMQFAVESAHAENALVSYSGFVDLSESSFDIQSTQTTASYQLLSLQKRSVVKWNDDLAYTASGIDSSRLVWKDGVLYWDISGNVTESKQVLGDYIFSTDWILQHVTDKNQITGTGNLAFCLDSDVEWDGLASSLINNSSSHVFITGEESADGKLLYSFDFNHATSTAFKVASLMVADLKEVTFSGNTASGYSAYGGAIDATTVTLSGNGDVIFSGNTSSGSYAHGGAIDANEVTLSGNGAVTFSGNTASGSYADGGAIYAGYNGTVTLSGNGAVTFSGNTASSEDGHGNAYGGAIDAGSYGTVTLSGNGDVIFSGNTSSGSYADGGAIDVNVGTVTLSGNGAVTFSGNRAIAAGEYSSANGGAIGANVGTVELSGNGEVTFSGNTARGYYAEGGAIDATTVTLSGNGDVLFEKNAEVANGTYRLRSIYTENLNLSASEGKKIEFRDKIYASGTVNLNEDYTDAEGVVHKQTGDIIFTGATTEDDLIAVKKAHLLAQNPNADVSNLTAKDSEITNSRTSIVAAETHLYGGRLRIEDGAVYQGVGLTVHENSAATVLLKDATMTHAGQAVSFASGTTLAAAGVSHLTATSLTMADGAAWSFEVSAANADKTVLTYSGDLTLSGKLSVNLTTNSTLTDGVSYQLLTGVAKPTNWTADNITVTTATSGWFVDFADLTWVDNTLWLYYDTRPDLTIATWTNESNDGLWNTSSVNWEQDEYDYAYQNGVQVVFGDKGADTVTLVGDLAPESVLVNSSQNYSFEGAGKLTGSMKLTKQGSGTLTIDTANNYTGGTLISGGKLVADNATALGTGAVELADATLEIGATGFANAISASGTSTLKIADGITHQLNATLTNSGTLTLIGAVDASDLAVHTDEMLVNTQLQQSTSGFLKTAGSSVDIMDGSGTLVSSGAKVLVNGQTVTLDAGGYGQLGQTINYGLYTINDTAETASAIMNAAKGEAVSTDVVMKGGSLSINTDMTGSLSLAGTAYASVDAAATVAGDVVLNGGTLALTGKKLTISGKLDVESASDLLVGSYGAEGLYTLISFGSFEGSLSDLTPVEQRRASSKKTLLTTDNSMMLVVGDKLEWTGGNITAGTLEDMEITYKGSSNTAALITGSSSVTVESGDVTLSGNNSYTGGTIVNGGSLIAGSDTAFGTGAVTVNDATLDLNRFTVSNTVQLNGQSTLGYANGASHIVLGGGAQANFRDGYTLSSGKTLEVSAGGATYAGALTLGGGTLNLAGMLTVTGDVVFESGKQTTIDVSGWSGLDDGDVLIDFGGSLSGYTDSSLKLSGMAGEWELAFDAATGVLTLAEVKPEPAPEPAPEPEFKPSLSPNQQLVYDTMKDIMDEATPDGLLGELGKEVTGTRDEEKLKQLLDELGGAEYAALLGSQQAAASGHMRRLRRGLGSGWALAGTKARANIEVYSHRSELDADSRGRGYELTETGGQFSIEFISDEHTSGGFAVASGRSKLQPDGGMTQHSDNTYVDAFLVHRDGAYTGKFSLGVGVHKYDLDRRVAGREVSADTSGSSVNFMHESTYAMQLDETSSVHVFGAVESSMNKLGAFTEQGADTASLQVEGQDAWVTTLSVGVRYNYSFAVVDGAAAATLSLQAGVEYDLGDTDSEVEMSFEGARGHSFRQSGAERDTFGYNLGASLHLPVSAKAAIYASGDAVLRGNSNEVNANVGLQMAF